ncbi:MAG: phosphatase PAP2 family protein [Rhodospirillales bacterium]|nr:MAG: phosphatase PAP2 family protein [Rhodospirillales bacterium]
MAELSQARNAAPAPLLRAARRIPRWLAAALALAAGFGLVVTGLGWLIGVPLAAPTERVSLALGLNAGVPILLGFLGYGLARTVNMAATRRLALAPVGRAAAVDATVFVTVILVMYFHFNLKMWVPLINPERFDAAYMETDRWLAPVIDLFRALRGLAPVDWAWFDQLYQLGFVLMFVVSFAILAVSRDRHYPHFVLGIMLVLVLGGLAYLIAPAVGPFIFEDGMNRAAMQAQAGMWRVYGTVLREGAPWIAANGSEYFTGALAAMPSLHIAHAAVMTWYMHQSRLAVRWPFLVILIFILVESVVSRWHYLIDAPAGLLVAAAAIVIANRICDGAGPDRADAVAG